jgi:nitrogenase molybdenum-iron protein beta chain
LYTIADSTYGVGLSKFFIEELGFTPRKYYGIDITDQKVADQVTDLLTGIDARYEGTITYAYDNRVIQDEIEADLKETKVRSVILGSSWDKKLAKENNDSILLRISLPITDKVIVKKSYIGYQGGLTILEDLYSELFADGMITNTTHAEH